MNLTTSKIGTILDLPDKERDFAPPAGNGASRPRLEIRARPFDGANVEPAHNQNLLSNEEQDWLLHNATPLAYRRSGITIFSEGQSGSFLYIVDEGTIRICRCAESGRRQILAFKVSGDLFGLPENGQYVNSAETVGPGRVYRIPWQRMQQVMLVEPQIQLHLLMKVADDFRQAERRIMTLGQQDSCQRLASFILDLLRLPEFFDENRSLLTLSVNRFDLADYLGMVTKSSERAFATLERQGLIRRITSRTIEILDIGGLQRLQHEHRRCHR